MLDAEYSMFDAGFGLQVTSDRIAGLGWGVLMIESALTDSFSSMFSDSDSDHIIYVLTLYCGHLDTSATMCMYSKEFPELYFE